MVLAKGNDNSDYSAYGRARMAMISNRLDVDTGILILRARMNLLSHLLKGCNEK